MITNILFMNCEKIIGKKVIEKIIITDIVSLYLAESRWWIWLLSAINGLLPWTSLLQNSLIKSIPGIIIKINISSKEIKDNFRLDLIIKAAIINGKK